MKELLSMYAVRVVAKLKPTPMSPVTLPSIALSTNPLDYIFIKAVAACSHSCSV